jgi:hypothetical protein
MDTPVSGSRCWPRFAGARLPIQVDIGFGDAVMPGTRNVEYPSLLDMPAARLRAYLQTRHLSDLADQR